jgi:8-hydroxy-5-deazaflavin:NADPH oxidoreductase
MRIGIVGTGYIGATAARLFVRAGHEVAVSNSRDGAGLEDLVGELGDRAHAASVEDAARFGDVVLVSIPFGRYTELPAASFDGKIVIDTGNYYPDRDGRFAKLDDGESTSSELVAAHLRGARLVKAFNTIYYVHLAEQGDASLPVEKRRAVFVAGDDEDAKRVVSGLVEEIGFAAVDTGSLRDGGALQQPGTAIYNRDVTAEEARALL